MIISDWAYVGAYARKSKSHTGSPTQPSDNRERAEYTPYGLVQSLKGL
jgi:hypothetical protein